MMKNLVHVSSIVSLKVLYNPKSRVLIVGKNSIDFNENFLSEQNRMKRSVSTKNDLVRDISLQLPSSSTSGNKKQNIEKEKISLIARV